MFHSIFVCPSVRLPSIRRRGWVSREKLFPFNEENISIGGGFFEASRFRSDESYRIGYVEAVRLWKHQGNKIPKSVRSFLNENYRVSVLSASHASLALSSVLSHHLTDRDALTHHSCGAISQGWDVAPVKASDTDPYPICCKCSGTKRSGNIMPCGMNCGRASIHQFCLRPERSQKSFGLKRWVCDQCCKVLLK